MAQIDASGLGFTFNATLATSVQHFGLEASSSDYYTWVTGNAAPFYRITASSFDGGVTATPLGGTIDTLVVTNDAFALGFSITGLNVALVNLIDTSNATTNFEKFWEQVLAGATTVIMPSTDRPFSVMGDYVNVNAGQNLVGANDLFIGGKIFSTGVLIGDALNVAANATLRGGSDTWNDVSNTWIIGDVGDVGAATGNFGTVNGGADTINLIDGGPSPTLAIQYVVGDVWVNNGVANGGADAITLRDIVAANFVAGDTNLGVSGTTSRGGADDILIETTIAGRSYVSTSVIVGDDLNEFGAATGGADSITLRNVLSSTVSGDFQFLTDAVASGGADLLDLRGTFGVGSQLMVVGVVAGDVFQTGGTAALTGGDDQINLTNVFANLVAGDVNAGAATGAFVGGDDTISCLFNRNDVAPSGTSFAGDALTSASNAYTGGSDEIALNVMAAQGRGTFALLGEGSTVSVTGSAVVNNGDDILRITSNAGQSAVLYGDLGSADTTVNLTLNDGDDSLTGGGGFDVIYGDTSSVSHGGTISRTGGDDTLDGRGGDDFLIGGLGSDTAVFSLNQSVYVNLNGIVGSSASELYEAVGQGNDQLFGIENVTGSALGDVIVANNQFNVLTGLGGADSLNGRGGDDTASYAGSNAGVVVNLSTGVAAGGHAQGDELISIERLIGSSFADTFVGTAGINLLDGRLGADSLRGLGGSDSYYVDNAGDIVDEAFAGSGGTDLVYASVSVSLTNAALFKGAIENVTLLTGVGLNVVGNALDNTIIGNTTGNALSGGLGNDTLTGGGGTDRFLFNTTLNAMTNFDTIADFALDDRIDLDDAIFTLLTGPGTLTAAQFKNTASGAIDANDRIIYNSGSGALFYDTNGSGAGGSTQFAQLGTGLGLTNSDFLVL